MGKNKDVSKEAKDEEIHEDLEEEYNENDSSKTEVHDESDEIETKKDSRRSRRLRGSRTVKDDSGNPWMYASIALAILLVVSIFTNGFKFSGNISDTLDLSKNSGVSGSKLDSMQEGSSKDSVIKESTFSGKPVVLEMYVMSQCPYGTQVMDSIEPVKKGLGDALDLQIEYIMYPAEQYAGQEAQYCVEDLCSMHGVPEVKGDIVQLCARKYYPVEYYGMLGCMNADMMSIPNNWESCAEKMNFDIDKIKSCYDGEEGIALATESAIKAMSKGATGSPTIFLNGLPYTGGRNSNDFLRAVCNAFENSKPDACASVPEPVKFDLTVVTDSKCSSCDPSQIIAVSMNLFPGVKVKTVDINSDEGKALVDEHKLVFAPSYLFDKKVTETDAWNNPEMVQLKEAFEKKGDYYKLIDSQSGASYYIDEVARKEAEEKPKRLLGIEDGKVQMDFFVMSFCPYGIQAEQGIIPVESLLRSDASFIPHYVIYNQGTGCRVDQDGMQYCAMHGGEALNEDIRQLCIWNDEQDKYFAYIDLIAKDYFEGLVSSTTIKDKWKGYAEAAGIDIAKIESCYNDEARVLKMLKEEYELNQELGVRGSPTIFINGASYNGARTSGAYQQAVCSLFDDAPDGCNQVLEGAQAAPATGSC